MQNLKKNWLVASSMLLQLLKSLKISYWWVLFVHSIKGSICKDTEELFFMTLKSDLKFE